MMTTGLRLVLGAVMFFTLSCVRNECYADFIFNLAAGGQFAPAQIDVNAGDTITLDVLITQTGPETRLNNTSSGLVSANFSLDSSGSFATPVSYTLGLGLVERPNAVGNPNNSLISGGLIRVDAQTSDLTGATGVTTANTALDALSNSVLLASIDYAISPTASGVFALSVQPEVDGFGDRVSVVGAPFPDTISVDNGSVVLSVNAAAVPEPSAFAMTVLGVLCIGLRRRFRLA